MKCKILVADDEENYRKLVKMFLENAGYEVLTACNGEEVLEKLSSCQEIDLLLLDVLMPGLDGRETCEHVRSFSDIPVIMLTALGDEHDEILGIQLGADDYISKPFSSQVLLARVGALLRRVQGMKNTLLQEEGMTFIDADSSVKTPEGTVVLTPKEFQLLKFLVLQKNKVLSRDQILDHVWGFDYFGDRRTVDTHVKSLRAKLGQHGSRIRTIRGKGYSYRGKIG
ncbi:MAG TPA: response regulator transcription factor [Thermotogota bacterium]|nr:response regulator transcription factor [Thermotogota bacterium]HRW93316.1 response regulator transcription factor [Thermotogota bacterium]